MICARDVGVLCLCAAVMTSCLLGVARDARAETPGAQAVGRARGVVRGAMTRARGASRDVRGASRDRAARFREHVQFQAALEAQIGLRLYREGDDYRAITALQRYAILDGTAAAKHRVALITGHIYHRNAKHQLAAERFELAMQHAPSLEARTWSYLLSLQELCIPLSLYYGCRRRLDALAKVPELPPRLVELIAYQRMYTDVVLRQPGVQRAARLRVFKTPLLREHAQGLQRQDRAFDALDLQRPWLAASLSAILPGAGQAYNGRWGDALVALSVNGALGAATYYGFHEKRSVPLGVVAGVLLAGFYVGTITNAYTDARTVNARRYQSFFEQLKRDHWSRVSFDVGADSVRFGYQFDWPGESGASARSGDVF